MSKWCFIAPIVEGHGEVDALPSLLQRIARDVNPQIQLKVNQPFRVPSGSFLNKEARFGDAVDFAVKKAKQYSWSCVLIWLDLEDDCPAKVGPALLARAQAIRPDGKFLVVLVHREFETWFLASARSLRGVCGLPVTLEPPANPESIRNAKGWISKHLLTGYKEKPMQRKLTESFSFAEAVQVPSFKRALVRLREFFAQT